jgi:hypothetical protein
LAQCVDKINLKILFSTFAEVLSEIRNSEFTEFGSKLVLSFGAHTEVFVSQTGNERLDGFRIIPVSHFTPTSFLEELLYGRLMLPPLEEDLDPEMFINLLAKLVRLFVARIQAKNFLEFLESFSVSSPSVKVNRFIKCALCLSLLGAEDRRQEEESHKRDAHYRHSNPFKV